MGGGGGGEGHAEALCDVTVVVTSGGGGGRAEALCVVTIWLGALGVVTVLL